jgi:hypothetical protein
MNLDRTSFHVTATAAGGVVGRDTRLDFAQRGSRVLGRYSGGAIQRGVLVGELRGRTLSFRYAQTEATGQVHGGASICRLQVNQSGRLRIYEHFVWETRPGHGTNVFDQIPG